MHTYIRTPSPLCKTSDPMLRHMNESKTSSFQLTLRDFNKLKVGICLEKILLFRGPFIPR